MTDSNDTTPVDPRPQPRYGQYAPLPPAGYVPPAVNPEPIAPPVPVVRPRRTWDIVLTASLLLVGVYDVVAGFSQYLDLGPALVAAFEQQGFGEFTSFEIAAQAGIVLTVIRVVILIIVVLVSLRLISRGRRAFWVPLLGGVLAALALMVCIFVIVLGDPSFAQYVDGLQ
ncbi:hypothetical protein BH10ACT7_BH10ACT7_15400 [soil metagenome]